MTTPAPAAPPAPPAQATIVFDNLFANGPIVTGAVVDTDIFTPSKDGIEDNNTINLGPTIVSINAFRACGTGVSARIAALVGAAAGLMRAYRNFATDGVLVNAAPTWYAHDGARRTESDAAARAMIFEAANDAFAIMVCTKVNFWKQNHHTGQGTLTGLVRKAVALRDIQVNNPAEQTCIWRIGHWLDTRLTLSVLGIQNINNTKGPGAAAALAARISLTDDVRKRIASCPAGTAPWSDVYEGIRMAITDPVATAYPILFGIEKADADATASAISSGDAHYHVGSDYLTGQRRIIVNEFPSNVVDWTKTAVMFISPSSTLLNAIAFQRAQENTMQTRFYRAIRDRQADAVDPKTVSTKVGWAKPQN